MAIRSVLTWGWGVGCWIDGVDLGLGGWIGDWVLKGDGGKARNDYVYEVYFASQGSCLAPPFFFYYLSAHVVIFSCFSYSEMLLV